MPHDCEVNRSDGHREHRCDEDLSRQHMASRAFAEKDCSHPGQQPYDPGANVDHEDGRIGHWHLLKIRYADSNPNVPCGAETEELANYACLCRFGFSFNVRIRRNRWLGCTPRMAAASV